MPGRMEEQQKESRLGRPEVKQEACKFGRLEDRQEENLPGRPEGRQEESMQGRPEERINTPLLAWYREHARDLPWREKDPLKRPDPYRVWVSEIMLQQTRVETVGPYYERFLAALPDVAALAACPEDRLLKLWEGLGYYSRVRNMQRCAKELVAEHGGCFPADEKALLALPGIGPYTAGAIASIAFGLPVPAVDGNVLRVISRVTGSAEDVLLPETRKKVDLVLRETMPAKEPGAFNQALMDLGAMICLPGMRAACQTCPLYEVCVAGQEGRTEELPVRRPTVRKKKQDRTVLIIRDGAHMVLCRREKRGLLAGLYEPPCLEGKPGEKEVLSFVRSRGLFPLRIRPLPEAKHVFTHLIWQMTGFEILVEDLMESKLPHGPVPEGEAAPGEETSGQIEPGQWFAVRTQQVGEIYAIPSAYRAYV